VFVACVAAVGACAGRFVLGPDGIDWPEAGLADLRGLRVVCGVVVGGSLGVSGVLMQSLLRNPLASPDLMGVASGSGLFVMLAALLAGGIGVSFGAVAAPAALAGAFATLGLIYMLARTRAGVSVASLTLVGVAVGFLFGSLGMLVQHLLADRGIAAQRWLLGSLRDDVPWSVVGACAAGMLLAAWSGWRRARAMDACTLGDEAARSMGVALGAHRATLFAAAGTLAAVSVYLAGPIGFVGLVGPHLVRLAAGPGHRTLVPAAGLVGAALVVSADGVVRLTDLPSGRLPLGVVTSVLGAPVLIVMLRRRR
jgi:iron complex transport system permease protein